MPPYPSALLLALALSSAAMTAAGPTYTDWGPPVRPTAIEAPGYLTVSQCLSKDGTRLYFGSNRPGGAGEIDIWLATRDELSGEWNAPVNLGSLVNSDRSDWYPALSRDEHWLFFMSSRAGGYGRYDLWASYRDNMHDDHAWQAPVNLGPAINSAGDDASPSFFANDGTGLPQLFFTSNGRNSVGDIDVFVAEMVGPLEFLPATPVEELNTVRNLPASKGLEVSVAVRHDGLELFLTSNRPGTMGEGLDLWVATRDDTAGPWSTPVNLGGAINTANAERDAAISADRLQLFFKAGEGIYVSTREKLRQP